MIRAFARPAGDADSEAVLGLAGEALAAGGDELRTAEQVTRLATDATGALAGLLWRRGPEAELELVASVGAPGSAEPLVAAQAAADRALVGRHAVSVESVSALPGAATLSATLQLGQPPLGALQLLFARDTEAGDVDLATLATFGVRAAHALRASMHARSVELELGRTRALLGVVGQAISQLSLAHTLETAVARVGELLEADRLAVYLREDDRLYAAAGLGLAGPHARLAERLLDLTLGPFRSRGMLVVDDVSADQRLSGVADAAAEAGIEAAIAVPLLARDEVIGLLGVFPASGRVLDRERVGTAGRARGAAGGGGAERAAARAREAARRGAGARARSRARGVEAGARAVRDLTFVRAEPVARSDARGGGRHDRGVLGRRRRAHSHARRAPRVAACRGR